MAKVLSTTDGRAITCDCGRCVAVTTTTEGRGLLITWDWADEGKRGTERPTASMDAGECEECGGGILSAALRLVS